MYPENGFWRGNNSEGIVNNKESDFHAQLPRIRSENVGKRS